jgi:outer membrane protein TolC
MLVQGCLVGPNYVEPEIATPDAWQAAVAEEMSQPEPDITTWWETLDDTLLTDLIRRAELANLDLRTAVARVREARAARGIAKGDYFPQVALQGTYSYFRLSENASPGKRSRTRAARSRRRTSGTSPWAPSGRSTCSGASGGRTKPPGQGSRLPSRTSATCW